MQQIVLPSPHRSWRETPVITQPFPLVRPSKAHETRRRTRKFLAGLLFGLLMSGTLVLLGYEARVVWDERPELRRAFPGWFR